MAREFSIGNALSFGWDAMKKNFTLFLYIMLTFLGIQLIVLLFDRIGVDGIIGVVAMLAYMILRIGVIDIVLGTIDGRKTDYRMLFAHPSMFPDFLIGTILYLLIILGGLVLLVVPGIIWAVKFSFYGYYIVDKKMGPFDALKASAKATYGHKWDLFLFWLAIIGVNIVGALALLIGLFATIPTTEIAYGYAYRTMDAQNPQKAPIGAPAAKAVPAKRPAKAKKKR